MTNEPPTMRQLLRGIGWTRFFSSIDFKFSIVATFIFGFVIGNFNIVIPVINSILPIIVGISGVLIAIALAGLAIIVAMSDPEFVKILKENNVFDNLLMFFWIPAFSAMICIILSLSTIVIQMFFANIPILLVLSCFSFGSFLYTLSSLILAIGTAVLWGHYRAEFIMRGIIGTKKT